MPSSPHNPAMERAVKAAPNLYLVTNSSSSSNNNIIIINNNNNNNNMYRQRHHGLRAGRQVRTS